MAVEKGEVMNSIRRAACVLLVAASLFVPFANATSFSTDQSDLWYIPSESGWGMQLVQRGDVIFATLFVYDQSGTPIWYTATLEPTGTGLNWSGTLYVTAGPWFGTVPFNPTLVGIQAVGTMTWNGQFVETGTLTYSVDGVVVNKSVVRQPLVLDNFNGAYLGALNGTASGCTNPANDVSGTTGVNISVNQSGPAVNISVEGTTGASLVFDGTLTQGGQFGKITGSYTSSSGEAGTFSMFEINGQLNFWTARFSLSSTNDGCQSTGYLGGMRE
jgi:hypothetical protein